MDALLPARGGYEYLHISVSLSLALWLVGRLRAMYGARYGGPRALRT